MKKRLLGLVSIICLLAVIFSIGATSVSAKEIQYRELVTVDFSKATVGATATAGAEDGGNEIATGLTSRQNFTKIISTGTKGKSTITIMEEGGEKFARMAATNDMKSGEYAIMSFDPEDPTGATDYRLTITYRLSEDFETNSTTANGSSLRVRTRGSNNTNKYATFEANMNELAKGEWLTSTIEVSPVLKVHAFHVIVYAAAGTYIDVKDFKIEENPLPEFGTYYEFDAEDPEDVEIEVNLFGREIDEIWLWNEDQYEITDKFPGGLDDPDKVREDLGRRDYEVDEDDGVIVIYKEFLEKLSNGQKSIIFEVGGIEYAVNIFILNSDVHDDPICLHTHKFVNGVCVCEAVDPNYTPDKGGCGSVIGTTSAVLASILLAGAVVVFKKKD